MVELILIVIIGSYLLLHVALTGKDISKAESIGSVQFSENTKIYEVDNEVQGTLITDAKRASIVFNNDYPQSIIVNFKLRYPGDAILIETYIDNSSSQDVVLNGFEVTDASKGIIITQPSSVVLTPNKDKLDANIGICKTQFLIKWNPTVDLLEEENQSLKIGFTYSDYETGKKCVTTLTHSESQ